MSSPFNREVWLGKSVFQMYDLVRAGDYSFVCEAFYNTDLQPMDVIFNAQLLQMRFVDMLRHCEGVKKYATIMEWVARSYDLRLDDDCYEWHADEDYAMSYWVVVLWLNKLMMRHRVDSPRTKRKSVYCDGSGDEKKRAHPYSRK